MRFTNFHIACPHYVSRTALRNVRLNVIYRKSAKHVYETVSFTIIIKTAREVYLQAAILESASK